jgi:hypothetical protein
LTASALIASTILTFPSKSQARLWASRCLQIEWGVVPNGQDFLDALTWHKLVLPTEESSNDFINLEELSRAEQEARLLELAESGDMIGAIAAARKLYSYDLTTAKDFVEGLVGKRSKA